MPNEFERWLNGGTTGQSADQVQAAEEKPDGDAFLKWLNGGQASVQEQAAPDTSGAAQPAAPVSANPLLPGNIGGDNGLGPATVLADEEVSSDVLPGTGGFVLVPSVDDAGNDLTKEQMVERYRADGRNYGTFDTRESAIAYQAEHSSEDTRALVRAQLLQAQGISLEQQAKDREMARRLGLPPTVISYQREWAENENAALMFEQYQGLMEFAAKSPENAAIAKGDMETLGQIAASKVQGHFYEQDPLESPYLLLSKAQERANILDLYRNSRLVGPEGEATLGDRWAMGEIGRQQAALGRRYLEEGVDISEDLARLDKEMLPYSQKVIVQGPIEEFLGMGIESLPSQLQMYATGAWSALATGLATYGAQAAINAAAGSAAGPVGTAVGAASGVVPATAAARAGWIAGIAKDAFELESGNMAVTLLREKDADGNAMPREVIKAASTVYGLASGVIEAANEGLLLKLLGPLGLGENLGRQLTSEAGRASLKTSLKMALVNAAKDKSVRDVLLTLDMGVSSILAGGAKQVLSRVGDVAGRLLSGAVSEGVTETLQEGAAIFTEVNARLQSNAGSGTNFDANLPDDTGERLGESFLGGMSGSLLLGFGPVVTSSAMRAMSAHAAANFAQQQNELHAVAEQAALKQQDPELFEQKLTELNPAMGERVTVPMDEAVKLYQSGVDILTPLGVSLEAAQVDAAAGQSLTVSLASLHARLDQTQFEAAAQIMHRSPEAESAQDVQTISEDTVRAFQDMIDNAQENQAAANGTRFMTQEQREEFDNSFTAWQGQIRESVLNNPKLLSQLGSKRNVDRFVNSNAELMRKRALLEARRTGRAPADMLQRVFLRNSARWRAWEAGRRGDTEAQLAAELEAQAVENEQAASLQRRSRRVQRRDSYQGVRDVTMQAPTEVEFSGENVWRPANRPEYTPEQLSARRALSTLDPEDTANWLETTRGRYKIRYEVWELADLLPSHDPFNQFQRAPEYPSIAQERAYHKVRSEQDKVRRNAVNLNPRYLVTDSPDASSGPPVVTTDGVVLGGNSRTMSMQLAFTRPEKLKEYRGYLSARAQNYGIDPATFSGMQAPVLVRVLQGAMSQDEMAIASNAFNQTSTEELDVVAEGVSKSRRIDDRILTEIGSALENYDTLREYMGSRESRDLVQMLIEREIIAPNQVGRMVTKDGMLTSTGKDLLESALRGLIIQDYDILANASENVASVLNKIDRAILSLVRLKRIGGKWDLSKIVAKALQQIYRADASTPNFRLADLPGYFASGDLGGVDPDRGLRSVQAIALTLANSQTSVREAAARFNVMASIAEQERSSASMGSLVPREPVTPEQAFIQAFLSPVATVDNKPVLNFRPEKNTRHAAMQWTSNASSLPDATSKLEQLAVDDKLSEDERNMYKEYGQELAKLGAEKVAVYQPKVGEFFSYDRNADTLWQSVQNNLLVRDGITRKPDSATAKVVRIPENGVPEFASMKEFANWLKDMLAEGGNVLIKSTGQEARFSSGNVKASVKRSRSKLHRDAYAGLRQMVENAEYDHYEKPDERHPDRGGQDVYYSALAMGDKLYSVKIKLDVVTEIEKAERATREDIRYKDHKLTEIEIASVQDRGVSETGEPTHGTDAINKVSLGVLRGAVKPSRIENYTLYQTAYHGTPGRFDAFSTEHIGEGEGAQQHGWGLYFAADRQVSEDYRRRLSNQREGGGEGMSVSAGSTKYTRQADGSFVTSSGRPVKAHIQTAIEAYFDSYRDVETALDLLESTGQPEAVAWLRKNGNRLRVGEGGQVFAVDVPENDVLLDEQKTFEEQPEKVREAVLKLFRGLTDEQLQPVRQEIAATTRMREESPEIDRASRERRLARERAKSVRYWNQNKVRPADTMDLFAKNSGYRYDTVQEELAAWYTPEEMARIQNDDAFAAQEYELYNSRAKELSAQIDADRESREAERDARRAAVLTQDIDELLAGRTGEYLYSYLHIALGSARAASLALNEAGVKGITYVGQADGRCFVVFDDKAVEVLRTFYQDQVIYPNNGKPVGQISPEIAQTLHLNKPGAIVLDDIGLQHIEDRHSKEIRTLGFANARDFVLSTLANVSAVYDVDGKGRKYDLVSRGMDRQRRVMVRLEFSETGDYYSVVTAGPLRDGFFNNKTPLWERAPSNHSTMGTPDAISGQSGVLQQSAAGGINLTSTQQGVNQNPSVNDVLDQAEELHRGGVTSTQGNYIIDLFQSADLSTLLHEMGHVWFMELERAVREGYADETMRADFDKLCKWVGGLQNNGGLVGRLTIEQHEQLARGLEAYFLEGKAPSEELRGVFANFRKWLKRIYQTVANLGVKLNDEVRGVFDRMFATQEEIEEVAATNGFVNLSTGELDILGVPKSQQEYTRMVLEAAKEKAVERLQTRRDTERRNRMREYYKRARKEVSERPVYTAMRDMRKTPLDATAVRNMLGDETLAALQAKGITFTELGGQDPTVFAARHGFDSVEAMATELLQADDIRQATRRRMQEMSDEYDAQFDALDELLDSNELVEHASLVARHLAKVGSRPYIHQSAINQVVDNLSANKTVSELMRVSTFLSNMRSALKKERKAIAQGDFAAAIEANTQARLNLEMARRAKNLRDRTEKLPRRVKRALGTKVIPEVVKYGLMTVASNHGVVPLNQALASKYSPEDFNVWLKGVKDNGFDLLLDEGILVTFNTWQQMKLEQFEDLENTLNQIITLERNQRKLLTSQRKESLDEAADNIAKSVMAHGELHEVDTVNGERRILSKLKRFHVAHMKVEELCIEMDGGVVGGPVWTYIYKPIADAENRQVLRLKEVRNYIKNELFGRYYSKSELVEMGSKRKKVLVPEINKVMNKEQRLAVALNMGNETNIDRLRSGFEWTDEQIRAVVSTLDERDWQFVQAVWDYFDTFRPEAFAMEERLTGARPRAVVPQPFQVTLSDGKTVSLRGGYYPIKYNSALNSVVHAREQKALDEELMGGRNYSAAMTRHDHLKERSKKGEENAPLLLSLGVIPEHLYNTVHDICYRPAVIDVNRVIQHRAVRNAIESYAGREIYQALRPWLVDCANESTVQQSDIYAFANWARASMSIGSMGFKATTILTQMAGLTTTVDVLGAKWTAKGFARVLLRNPSKMAALWEETKMRSPFMAGRLESFDRDMRDTAKRIQQSRTENVLQTVRETAFKPMAYMQLWSVDLPTWWGAYEKGLQDFHGDEAMAVDYADSMVRQTQGSGSTKDLSAIQRGNDLQRLFTMFYSFFNVLYNLGTRHIKELRADHSPAGIWRASVHALLLWFLPVVLSEFLAGRWGGDDEDEDTLAWLTKLWLAYPLQSIIGVRDIVNATSSGFGYQLSPASAPPEAIVKAMRSIGKAIEEEDPSVLVKPTAQAIAYGFMLPGGQASITLENLYGFFSDPDSEVYVRDLFFRKPAERRD